ncbi:hypothetical protein VIBNISFn27_730047 [Vibrio nigripulchritudo SFn27]|nr:hypothetical protein VIBNISFn118_180025 [Vibrio nigripulchritudo SFn118]CCN85827.1 hypothetical protein VIBNIBLFn1_990011 [Vibrio nigripulchritudo BLFn1]CCN90522.1 hypothetical protein VIBNISFn27_730047 [Vibrio nigripulchritudo SFn27]CCN93641.1 hypothetical protein VIBNIENn2_260047 [Vibrio nigripulchritudo ENn2]CCO42963.1 hypothetical protein VIBNISFn135_90046 [Vibrio nigripulchritudo SFn135]CCO50756.1 hypothetical protein VIBNIWn13_1030046 [Vibrio nigripulchritudo Wn13]
MTSEILADHKNNEGKTMKISKVSLAVALTLSSASSIAQTSSPSFTESLEGRVMSYTEFADNKLNQKMLMTFAEQSADGSIAFDIDHTCGHVSGVLNLSDPQSTFGGDMNVTVKDFGYTQRCSTAEFDDLRALVTADNINSFRLMTTEMHLSSSSTGKTLAFRDATESIEVQNVRQSVFDSYWVPENPGPEFVVENANSVEPILEQLQHTPKDWSYYVAHKYALRIFETDNTDSGLAMETSAGRPFHITNGTLEKGNKGTQFNFDYARQSGYDFTQGSVNFGNLHWSHRIHLRWSDELRTKNRFQYDGNTLTLSSDSSEDNIKFKRLVKEARVADLRNTEWVAKVADQQVNVTFGSHSLTEVVASITGNGSKTIVTLGSNDSGSLNQAEVAGADRANIVTTELRNVLPETKSVIIDYSNPSVRKLHIVTASQVITLTEKKNIPIVFG